jgi:O-antigen ligase
VTVSAQKRRFSIAGGKGTVSAEKFSKNPLDPKTPLPLVPVSLLVPLWCVALALPNLVYSGVYWYDTLHLIKFAVAGVPVALAAAAAGIRLFVYGRKRIALRIDLFGAIWLGLIAYVVAQPLWVPVSSSVSFVQETLCFGAVWAFYVISWNAFPNSSLRPLLWLANLNAAVNVVFAELQIRGLNGFTRLILPTPGNYIGNTGQQNMFGLWMAICVMSSIYLYVAYATTPSGKKRHPLTTAANLLLMGVNMWGLLNSTSRSAILSLAVALVVLAFIVFRQLDYSYVRRFLYALVHLAAIARLGTVGSPERSTQLITKTADIIQNMETIGGRDGIWATSRAMFKMYPWWGVGIGQYKWHYLEAQREMLKAYPDKNWQYTHWAHNEFLQWFCEGGAVGGTLLAALWMVWGVSLLAMLWRGEHVALEVIWACSLVALVSFNALWTRPFHRIENILWLSLAFAISNRDIAARLTSVFRLEKLSYLVGFVLLAGSCGGLYYLGDGMVGDRMIREALSAQSAAVQRSLLERASAHFMVENEALKNLGYHYLQAGGDARDAQMLSRGYQLLRRHFLRESHSEELRVLLDWSQRFQDVETLSLLAGYLKPGKFRLGLQEDALDSAGNVVSAVILLPEGGAGNGEGASPDRD